MIWICESTEWTLSGYIDNHYAVVFNDEGQYSLWGVGVELPPGWRFAGFIGDKEECLQFIDENWLDMRPKTLRALLEKEARESIEGSEA
jgi:MbtH protein